MPRTAGGTCDAFLAFDITGDLAKVMTFHSLYRLERRGLLGCPIVGVAVDDWSVDDFREHARAAIEGTGEGIDSEVFDRLANRFSYVQGDLADVETCKRLAKESEGACNRVFYLEIPPSLFGMVVKGLSDGGLTEGGRVVVEKPIGHDLESARELAKELHEYVDESQLYRLDHFWERRVSSRSFTCGRQRALQGAGVEPNHIACVQITMAEDFGARPGDPSPTSS